MANISRSKRCSSVCSPIALPNRGWPIRGFLSGGLPPGTSIASRGSSGMAKGKQESETTQWIEKARDHRIHRPIQNIAYYGDKNVENWIGLVQAQALVVFGLRNT